MDCIAWIILTKHVTHSLFLLCIGFEDRCFHFRFNEQDDRQVKEKGKHKTLSRFVRKRGQTLTTSILYSFHLQPKTQNVQVVG